MQRAAGAGLLAVRVLAAYERTAGMALFDRRSVVTRAGLCALVTFIHLPAPAALAAHAAAGGATAVAAGQPACIAISLPSIRGIDGNATEVARSLRELIASFLTGPSLRAISLDARLPALALEEAGQKECGFLLTATATRQKHTGRFGRVMGQAAGAAAWHLPYGSGVATAATRTAVVTGAVAVSTFAAETRAKDEMQVEYRLVAADGSVVRDGIDRAKAKSDGEDLLTPIVERLAGIVLAAMTK